jgi:predicted permease
MLWTRLQRCLRSFLQQQMVDSELDEELNAHLELQIQKHIASGLDPKEARRMASTQFGSLPQIREECRETDRWSWADSAWLNVKHSFRSLSKSPAFVLAFILILTLGVASTVATFSTIDALFLRRLPVSHPEGLLQIFSLDEQHHEGGLFSSVLNILQQDKSFAGTCGFTTSYLAMEIEGTLQKLGMAAFSGSCFDTLGLRMQLGRPLTPNDDRVGTEPVAVITDSFWRAHYGGAKDVLGRKIQIGIDKFAIVGVTARPFNGVLLGFPEPVMIPLLQQPNLLANGSKPTVYYVNLLARLASGVSPKQALSGLLVQRKVLLSESVPHHFDDAQRKDYLARSLTVSSAQNGIDYFLRKRFGRPLFVIFGLCGSMLLMACLNLSSLLLSRCLNRQPEIGVRLALGATPAQVAALFVLGDLVLVILGSLFGIVVGLAIARAVLARGGQMFGNFGLTLQLDVRVLSFVAGLVLSLIAIFTAASFWQNRRFGTTTILKVSGCRLIDCNNSAQKNLLVLQVALTLVLVTASLLLGASVRSQRKLDFGIQPHNVWDALLMPRPGGYRNPTYWTAHAGAYYRGLLQQIESQPNVAFASLTSIIPFFQGGY